MGSACLRCNEELTAETQEKYCSRSCASKHTANERIERKCVTCGETWMALPSEVERGKAHFCSRECYAVEDSKRKRGRNNHQWRGGKDRSMRCVG